MRTKLRAILAAFTCLFIASSAGLFAAPPALAQVKHVTNPTCANVTVLGLRGHDGEEQRSSNGTASSNLFGFINSKAAVALDSYLPDETTVKRVEIPYVSASVIGIPQSEAEVASYRESISAASLLTVKTVVETLKECRNTKIVLIGFKQGAQVAHEAALILPESIMESIGAIWLIGDPLTDPKDTNQFQYAGSFPVTAGNGGVYITPLSQSANNPTMLLIPQMAPKSSTYPESLKSKVLNVCHYYDGSCRATTGVSMSDPDLAYASPEFTAVPARRVAESITALCNDVTFFAARGSGERFTGEGSGKPVQTESSVGGNTPTATESDYKQGFGVTLASLAFAIESKFDKTISPTFGHVAVNYEAISVPEAIAFNSQYPSSVLTGIDKSAGPDQFRQLIQRCPRTQVVMLGYSQGGHVMHEIVKGLTKEERSHVTTAILVADAIRDPKDTGTVTFMGTPLKLELSDSVIFNGKGIMRQVSEFDSSCLAQNSFEKSVKSAMMFFQAPGLTVLKDVTLCLALPSKVRFSDVVSPNDFPDDFSKRVINVCSNYDMICNTKLDFDPISTWETVFKKLHVDAIHGDGYKNAGFYEFPASWAYTHILRMNEMNRSR